MMFTTDDGIYARNITSSCLLYYMFMKKGKKEIINRHWRIPDFFIIRRINNLDCRVPGMLRWSLDGDACVCWKKYRPLVDFIVEWLYHAWWFFCLRFWWGERRGCVASGIARLFVGFRKYIIWKIDLRGHNKSFQSFEEKNQSVNF